MFSFSEDFFSSNQVAKCLVFFVSFAIYIFCIFLVEKYFLVVHVSLVEIVNLVDKIKCAIKLKKTHERTLSSKNLLTR